MEFVVVGNIDELPSGTMKKAVVNGEAVLIANVDGSFYAIADKCPHMGGSLADGKLEGHVVTCPKHGAQFDVKTGKAIASAKFLFMKFKVEDELHYIVKIDGDDILVARHD